MSISNKLMLDAQLILRLSQPKGKRRQLMASTLDGKSQRGIVRSYWHRSSEELAMIPSGLEWIASGRTQPLLLHIVSFVWKIVFSMLSVVPASAVWVLGPDHLVRLTLNVIWWFFTIVCWAMKYVLIVCLLKTCRMRARTQLATAHVSNANDS